VSDSEYRMPEKLGGEFEFEVGHEGSDEQPWYVVQLPHQCNEWTVAMDRDKTVVVAEVEKFVVEAQTALAKLREMP
jgi:hypothetical protein